MLLAGGQGTTDIAALLIQHGAPKDSTNVNGKGAVELGYGCSRTTGVRMKKVGAVETRPQRSGKTRRSDAAQSRQLRRAKLHGFAMAQWEAKYPQDTKIRGNKCVNDRMASDAREAALSPFGKV